MKHKTTNYRILIVDDDPREHRTLGDYLKLSGYEVFHAGNGMEGMESLAENSPDMILLDIQMPKMDGFQMLKKIRSQSAFNKLFIILMSFPDRRFLKQKGIRLGANDYIAKPFGKGDILAKVNRIFHKNGQNGSGVMNGDLSDLGLSDLLQSMELGTKTAAIFLEDIDGEIFIKDGALLNSRQGKLVGNEALNRIFLLEKGRFNVKFNHIPPDVSGRPLSMTSVLMDVTVTVDEIRSLAREIGDENRPLWLLKGGPELQQLEKYASLFPISFINLIVKMEGNLLENLEIVKEALQNGIIGNR